MFHHKYETSSSHELTQNFFVFCLVSFSYAFDITVSKHIYQTIKNTFFTYIIIKKLLYI